MVTWANKVLDKAPNATPDDIYYAWSEALTLDYADDEGDAVEPMSMYSEDCGGARGGWAVFDSEEAVMVTLAPKALRRGRVRIDDIDLEPVERGLIKNPGHGGRRK